MSSRPKPGFNEPGSLADYKKKTAKWAYYQLLSSAYDAGVRRITLEELQSLAFLWTREMPEDHPIRRAIPFNWGPKELIDYDVIHLIEKKADGAVVYRVEHPLWPESEDLSTC